MKSNYISKGIIMLLALAGSNYSYAQQATVVVTSISYDSAFKALIFAF